MAASTGAPKTERLPVPRLLPVSSTVDLPPEFVPIRLAMMPSGFAVELDRPHASLGRSKHCDLWLPMPDVSRQHARLFFFNGEWVIQDCGSLNGVFVNTEKVMRKTLRIGDEIRIGGFTLKVEAVKMVGADASASRILRSIADALPRVEHATPAWKAS
ncbi:MAG TPA: FHA domain-containing protein [Gemmataceae bacterium]|nr:FHA domain-containing protein [Gemmataceae bacterium]